MQEQEAKKANYQKILEQTGQKNNTVNSNKSIVEKLQSKQSRWRVLDKEEESDVDSEGNIKIKDLED